MDREIRSLCMLQQKLKFVAILTNFTHATAFPPPLSYYCYIMTSDAGFRYQYESEGTWNFAQVDRFQHKSV